MKRAVRSVYGSVFLAIGVALASCTGQETGNALPEATSDAGAPGSTEVKPGPPDVFGSMKACHVLDEAPAGQGYPAGETTTIGGDNGCQTNKSGAAVSLYLDGSQGIADLKGASAKKFAGEVNGRPSLLVEDVLGDGGGCQIGLEVAANARALLTVVLGSNRPTAEACELAKSTATTVEPRLPKA